MTVTAYHAKGLIGGAASDLDYIDGSGLVDNDIAFVYEGNAFYAYILDASSGKSESSPDVISPDSNAGTKRWILQNGKGDSPTAIVRPKFGYNTTTALYINPGAYYHRGTVDRYVYWHGALTYTWVNLTASTWCYLYIDDSAIVSADTNILTASEFIDSTTAPTWSASKHGYYNGNDLCIFATYGSTIKKHDHDGSNYVQYDEAYNTLGYTDIDTTWTDVTALAPGFCTKAMIAFKGHYIDGDTNLHYRVNGSSASNGQIVGRVHSATSYHINTLPVYLSSTQIFEIKMSASSGNTYGIDTMGWFFPRGM